MIPARQVRLARLVRPARHAGKAGQPIRPSWHIIQARQVRLARLVRPTRLVRPARQAVKASYAGKDGQYITAWSFFVFLACICQADQGCSKDHGHKQSPILLRLKSTSSRFDQGPTL
jgi:hypothetical protein